MVLSSPAFWNYLELRASFFYSLSCSLLARSYLLVLFRLRNSAFLRSCLASAIFSTFYERSLSRRDFICTGYFRGKLCHEWSKVVNLAISLSVFLLSSISALLLQFLFSSVTVVVAYLPAAVALNSYLLSDILIEYFWLSAIK